MNKLLIFLGIFSVLLGGSVYLGFFGNILDSFVLSIVIIILGFIRFNKRIGVAVLVIGIVGLLSSLDIVLFRLFPLWLLHWVLLLAGARFLLIGFFSEGNKA